MASVVAANKLELLQIADAVAREKLIEREIVIEAMEEAIQKAARAKYGAGYDIRANIDPKTGDLAMSRAMEVVEEVENPDIEILLEDARSKNVRATASAPLSKTCAAKCVARKFSSLVPHHSL